MRICGHSFAPSVAPGELNTYVPISVQICFRRPTRDGEYSHVSWFDALRAMVVGNRYMHCEASYLCRPAQVSATDPQRYAHYVRVSFCVSGSNPMEIVANKSYHPQHWWIYDIPPSSIASSVLVRSFEYHRSQRGAYSHYGVPLFGTCATMFDRTVGCCVQCSPTDGPICLRAITFVDVNIGCARLCCGLGGNCFADCVTDDRVFCSELIIRALGGWPPLRNVPAAVTSPSDLAALLAALVSSPRELECGTYFISRRYAQMHLLDSSVTRYLG